MTVKRWVLLGSGTLCVIITAVYLHLLWDDFSQKRPKWDALAKETFVEALGLEVKKRGDVPIQVISVNSPNKQMLEAPVPESVTLTSEYGTRIYKIPREKFEHSLVKEGIKRMLLSILLEKYPISVDTLNLHWDSLLLEKGIIAGTRIRYSVTDLLEQTTAVYSRKEEKFLRGDSLLSCYMGTRCEVEATGFISYNRWEMFGWRQWIILFLLWGGFFFFILIYERLLSYLRCKFRKKEIVVKEKEIIVEKEVIVEKKVRFVGVDAKDVRLYELEDGVFFDSENMTLFKEEGGITKNVAPQISILLKLFLNAEGHRLTAEEIDREIWNGTGDAEKLHTLMYRLRKTLKGISSYVVAFEGDGSYQLKIPISSRKKPSRSLKDATNHY